MNTRFKRIYKYPRLSYDNDSAHRSRCDWCQWIDLIAVVRIPSINIDDDAIYMYI